MFIFNPKPFIKIYSKWVCQNPNCGITNDDHRSICQSCGRRR